MRHFEKFCRRSFAVFVLLLALTCSAFADDGVMHPMITEPPPPPPPNLSGVMHPMATSPDAALDGWMLPGVTAPTTEIALSLLQGLLSQF